VRRGLKDSCTFITVTHNGKQASGAGNLAAFLLDGKPNNQNDSSKLIHARDFHTEVSITGRFGS